MTDLFGKELHCWPHFKKSVTRPNSLGRQMHETKTRKSTSLPNEATRLSFNKRPLFPTKAQNNGKLPRQLPS